MVMIPQVNDSVLPQGHVEIMRRAQANAEGFGGQVAQAEDRFGGDISEAASAVQNQLDVQDVTNTHVKLAQASVDGAQAVQAMASRLPSGDQSLVPQANSYMDTYLQNISDSAQTAKGRQLAATAGASLQADITRHAINVQGELNGAAAVNRYNTMTTLGTQMVQDDPTTVEGAVGKLKNLVNDPNGAFHLPGVTQEVRDAHLAAGTRMIGEEAAKAAFAKDPGGMLGALGPAAAKHDPGPALVQNGTVPGGQVSLSPETMTQAPQIFPAAAATGANPNLLLGQIQVGGTQDTSPTQLAVDMAALQRHYQGDQDMALAAYHSGAAAVDAAVNQWGFDWKAHMPEVATNYVDSVKRVSGMVPSLPAPMDPNAPPAPPPGPAPVTQSSIPGWNYMTGEQQGRVVQYGTELRLREMAEQRRTREDAKQAAEDAENAKITSALRQIDDPATNGKFDYKGFINDPSVTNKGINFIDEVRNRKIEQAQSNANRSDPGTYRGLWLKVTDPNPIADHSQDVDSIRTAVARGAISIGDGERLTSWAGQFKDDNGNPFAKGFAQVSGVVRSSFEKNTLALADPGAYQTAWLTWQRDAEDRISAARKAGKDPSSLLNPKSPDYLGAPDRVATFLPNAPSLVANQASTVAGPAKASLPSYKDFDSLAPGAQFTDPQGNVLRKKAPVKAAGVTGSLNLGGQ